MTLLQRLESGKDYQPLLKACKDLMKQDCLTGFLAA